MSGEAYNGEAAAAAALADADEIRRANEMVPPRYAGGITALFASLSLSSVFHSAPHHATRAPRAAPADDNDRIVAVGTSSNANGGSEGTEAGAGSSAASSSS